LPLLLLLPSLAGLLKTHANTLLVSWASFS
jgi:hypothetical protein